MGIRTVTVAEGQVPNYLEVPSRVQPDPTKVVRVFPPGGGRVLEVDVRPGDHVRKGQTLALLDSSDVSSARSDYQKAVADAEVKQKALARASLLFENQVFSEKEYQQARADSEIANAELERARSRLRVLGVSSEASSDRLVVTAPRAGVVLDIGAAPGEFSKSLDAPAPLCTLADLGTVWVVGDVYEKDVAGLKAGAPATVSVSAYPNRTWNARVAAISSALDPVTRTAKVRVVLANPQTLLKPEMFATIRLLRSTFSGIAIPASAVLREGDAAYVFVQKSPGHFERRAVTLGRALPADVEVTSGLRPGEAVVVEGALLLRVASQQQ
jgi:cobalt-zinc-cadmium efflux system membrane fusion protein